MENEIFILNPIYFLRYDIEKIILCAKNQVGNNVRDWVSYIHPVHAMILSFFTTERPLSENIKLLTLFLGKEEAYITKIISPFLENEEPLHVMWQGRTILFPKKILVRKEQSHANIELKQYQVHDFYCKTINLDSVRPLRAPLHFTFMLNNYCQTKCIYCYADKQTRGYQPLKTDRLLEIIEEAHRLEMQMVNMIGGEVFLHKDWSIILKKLVEYGFPPEIISTKVPLTKDILDKLKLTNYNNPIQISLDAADPDILKKDLYVDEKYWDKLKEGLLLIDKREIRYQVATILTKLNDSFEVMKDLYDFLKKLKNIESWRISPAWDSLYIDKVKFESIKSTKERVSVLYEKIENSLKPDAKFDIRLDYSALDKGYFEGKGGSKTFKRGRCTALQRQMFVLPDGQVTICEQLYWKPNFIIGNLKESSIEDIWNSEKVHYLLNMKQSTISKDSACSICKLYDECFVHRCWVDVIKAYGDENWDYPDPKCNKAPAMKCNISF